MINTCRHERIKLDITLGIFRGGEPILPVGNQKRREDRCLHHRLAIYGLDADISEVPDFQRLDEMVVYLYPAGNAVASTSGTIPPIHYLCEGVLPWYHTSFSTS